MSPQEGLEETKLKGHIMYMSKGRADQGKGTTDAKA